MSAITTCLTMRKVEQWIVMMIVWLPMSLICIRMITTLIRYMMVERITICCRNSRRYMKLVSRINPMCCTKHCIQLIKMQMVWSCFNNTYIDRKCFGGFAQAIGIQPLKWSQYYNPIHHGSEDPNPLPSCHVKFHGRPGTGKTFVMFAMSKIKSLLFRSNQRGDASPTTGCDTNIFNGTSHNHLFKIPVGTKFKKSPHVLTTIRISAMKSFCQKWQNIFLLMMDKDRMGVFREKHDNLSRNGCSLPF